MGIIAKAIMVTIAAVVLICCGYAGMRTADDPTWFVSWRNRLNGDPRDYPPQLKTQWCAQWNAMLWDPDLVRASPSLLFQYRLFGILLVVISGVLLLALLDSVVRSTNL